MKRQADNDGDSSSDDDFGPAPVASDVLAETKAQSKKTQKLRKLDHEKFYVENLPSSALYEKSFMHRDQVTHIVVAKGSDFIITGSIDGHVKFWKKMPQDIEFVKHYQAHLGAINCMVATPDGQKLVTTATDKMVKFFEIQCFDLANMISVQCSPGAAVWLPHASTAGINSGLYNRVAIADTASPMIYIYSSDHQTCLNEVSLHSAPVKCMAVHHNASLAISCDARGMIEYWNTDTFAFPTSHISFEFKSDTNLYDLAKAKTVPISIALATEQQLVAITSTDKRIRIFDLRSGKLKRMYDESADTYPAADYGRQLVLEREFENSNLMSHWNCVFDESGNFIIYGALTGIKIVNIVTNRLVTTLANKESGERFISVGLYQGIPKVDMQLLLARSDGKGTSGSVGQQTHDEIKSKIVTDPTVYATSFKRRRFYCISKRLPDESEEPRDVLNEKPTEDERQNVDTGSAKKLASEVVLRTTKGDIYMKLFPNECPKTVENFVTHSRNGYYDRVIFHRVIKGFMIQTGDPLGNGTGGESIWGGEFEDEFHSTLRHDRPYTVSMANSGPNTNGSQFFITTVPTPWLDRKHTVFGRVTKGFEVVTAIENVECHKSDKPYEEIKIINIDVIA